MKINADYTSLIVQRPDGGVAKDDRLTNYSSSFKVSLLVEALSYIRGRSIANQFDIDTPGDLAMLTYSGGAGPNLQRHIDSAAIDTTRLQRASTLFTDRDAEVVVMGRVGTPTWQYLEAETACRPRLLPAGPQPPEPFDQHRVGRKRRRDQPG